MTHRKNFALWWSVRKFESDRGGMAIQKKYLDQSNKINLKKNSMDLSNYLLLSLLCEIMAEIMVLDFLNIFGSIQMPQFNRKKVIR